MFRKPERKLIINATQMNTDIYKYYNQIKNKKDFEYFLKLLIQNYEQANDEWDNNTLPDFLEGLYGYNYNSDNSEAPTWKSFADMLLAAKVYE